MGYLIGQIIICLLVAFLFGLLIGCLLKSIFCKRRINELEVELARKPKIVAAVATDKPRIKDNLQEISGIGPKLDKMLNKHDIYSFKEVADLENRGVKGLEAELESFNTRITRDKWVKQAKSLHNKKYKDKL